MSTLRIACALALVFAAATSVHAYEVAWRDSMGGAFGGYKGSCSVLGRTVKALGKDIADWMAAPSMDADLGDLK